MVTVDEIRARVQAADEARIAVRVERAADAASKYHRLAELRAALAEGEAAFRASSEAALEVMSVDELAEFCGVPKREVPTHATPRASAVKARSTRSRNKTERRPVSDSTTATDPASGSAEAAE